MSLKSKFVGALAVAVFMACGSAVNAAIGIDLNLYYVGSTMNSSTAATRVAQNSGSGLLISTFTGGSISTMTSGLTQMNLADPGIQAVGLKNYFALYVDFTGVDPTVNPYYGTLFNVNVPVGMVPVSGNGLVDLTTNKFLIWNPTDDITGLATWDVTGDLGDNAGDLTAISIAQGTAASAYAMQIGTSGAVGIGDNAGYISGRGTLLGVFALAFTSTPTLNGLVSVSATHNGAGYYLGDADGNVTTPDSAVAYLPPIPVGVPEPASLGVLALGGLALLARRRK